MFFLHCRHASIEDPQPCRCPIWEDPESDGGPCDTCDHRAEWHLTPIEGSLEENRPLERCKADLLPGQPCPCPIWVDNDKSDNKAQCALCGHKKGWHRTKVSAMSLPSKAESMKAQGGSDGPSPEQQTHATTQHHQQISELMSRDHQSCPQLAGPSSSSSASVPSTTQKDFRNSVFDMLSGPSDPRFSFSPDPDVRRSSTVTERNPIKIASEHLRFIAEDPTDSPFVSLNKSSASAKSSNPFPSTASEAVRSAYLSQASPVLSSSSAKTNPKGVSPATPHSPFEVLQNDRLCTNYSPKHPINGASSGYKPQSLHSSKASSDQMTAQSSLQEDASHPSSSPSFTSGALPVYPFDGDAGLGANSARSKHTLPNPLRAEITSHVHVEELEMKSSAHPSELGIGKFSAENSPMSHEAQRQHLIKSTQGPKPFQMGNNISGLEGMFLPDIQLQRSEEYTSKGKNVTLSLSPPPSKHDFTPGEVLTVTIRLKPTTSDTTTEQVLSRWTNITIMLVGTIARNGRRDDHTMHEILRLERLIYPVVGQKRPTRPEWKMSLQIPTHANCPCGPGSLPLPKTCSDSLGHVSYSIILKAKRRQGIIGITTEAITADMRMSLPKTAPAGSLTTKPSSARSKSNWIALTGSHRAAITGTILTTQVDYVSPNRLRIVYRLELEFSPDSEVDLSVINDLCENTTVVLSGLAGDKLDVHDVRVNIGEHPRWHMSGYLDVNAPKAVRDSQHILRLSIHTVTLSQPVEVYAWLRELNSVCSIRLMGLGMPLIPCS
ncbi:uncharacterized protein MELLADRAFT_72843 [Melampsora larici-populina 98AG31]|uniref:Uncharacterized protein n=1 Tax=Melampsora larici-populina (strain 98AG31 / pathotype 3-4-7) TaxID=747676 RepID=F4RZU2_MELLP|nr:uncharacterized protein MELLADRAFT_72843 [Melampsora larici-populina 98AG31]EGG02063.1 hypothetical protein MELLADRAFT_72843 [Melampsora larici-populina 98AG31]